MSGGLAGVDLVQGVGFGQVLAVARQVAVLVVDLRIAEQGADGVAAEGLVVVQVGLQVQLNLLRVVFGQRVGRGLDRCVRTCLIIVDGIGVGRIVRQREGGGDTAQLQSVHDVQFHAHISLEVAGGHLAVAAVERFCHGVMFVLEQGPVAVGQPDGGHRCLAVGIMDEVARSGSR